MSTFGTTFRTNRQTFAIFLFILAVIAKCDYGYLVDHALAISKDILPLNYECKKGFFDLWRPYIESSNSKPKRKKQRLLPLNDQDIESNDNHKKIKDIISTSASYIVNLGRECGYFTDKTQSDYHHVGFPEKDASIQGSVRGNQVVEHGSDSPSLVHLQDGWYILPPRTAYLEADAASLQPLIDYANSKGLFDVVVLDPPWYNKSAKRSGKYSFLSLWQIKKLPVPQLLSDQGLVIVWVTNKPKYINFTKGELFTEWGIEYLAEWHWVKVTRTGELVVDLDSQHKRPYETIIIGRYNKYAHGTQVSNTTQSNDITFGIPVVKEKQNTYTTGSPQECNNRQDTIGIPVMSEKKEVYTTGSPQKEFVKSFSYMRHDNIEIPVVRKREQNATTGIPQEYKILTQELKDDKFEDLKGKKMVNNESHSDLFNEIDSVTGNGFRLDTGNQGDLKHRKPIPDHVVICSVPCQIHSRKPPLNDILSNFVNKDARCLEMFARNLSTGWTSWGNEVLKFQHTEFYDVTPPLINSQ